ncbi:MAG: aminoacyl-tRNA hydrolase [Planctomycetota bacterium]
MRVVIGLGNPGRRYEGSRHNLGYAVVDLVASRVRVSWETGPGPFEQARGRRGGRDFLLVKPTTFMNASGEAVRALMRRYAPEPAELLVVIDDLALPPGQVRVRRAGSDGGHKGLQSLIEVLGVETFPRIRLGIGSPPPGVDAVDYVLEKPGGDEEAGLLAAAVEKAADAVILWLAWASPDELMNRFNRRAGAEPADSGGPA